MLERVARRMRESSVISACGLKKRFAPKSDVMCHPYEQEELVTIVQFFFDNV